MRWSARQFDQEWDRIYESCDRETRELLDRRLEFLQTRGNQCDRPVSAALGDGIFELRAKKARMLFYFGAERDIIFVRCIVKKTSKVPREEIKLAKARRDKIRMHGLQTNALPN